MGDLGSIGDRKGDGQVESGTVAMVGNAKRVGVSRKAARVGVGEQSDESGTGVSRIFFGCC
jgi:hypothetical protein